MADTQWSDFPDQASLADTDTLLARTAAGGGVEVPGTALLRTGPKLGFTGSYLCAGIANNAGWINAHRFHSSAAEGTPIGGFDNGVEFSLLLYEASGSGYSTAGTAALLAKNSTTGRSINTAGTVNTSGADYAEYMTKAPGCGPIAKGEVVGVTAEGLLTRSWSEAVAFVVKSTDPAYVGGDHWGAGIDDPAEFEAARQQVDRIAFAGQVPAIVAGAFAAGDYIVAADDGAGGIQAVAIAENAITFEQYRRRVGRVWGEALAGRAWIDVQHG